MLGHSLGGTERTFKSFDNDAAILEVNVIQPQVADFGGSHAVLVRHNDHRPFPSALGFCCPEHREDFCWFEVGHRRSRLLAGFWGCWHLVFPKMQQYVQTLSSGWVANSFICDTAKSGNATQWL